MTHRYTVDEVYRSVIADVIDRVRGDFVADGVAECVEKRRAGGAAGAARKAMRGGGRGFFPSLTLIAIHSSPLDPSWTTCALGGRPNCGRSGPMRVQGKYKNRIFFFSRAPRRQTAALPPQARSLCPHALS